MNFNFIPHASQPLHQFFTFSPQLISIIYFRDSFQIFNPAQADEGLTPCPLERL